MNTTVKVVSGISILLLLGGGVVYKLNENDRIAQGEIKEELKPIGYSVDATTVRVMDFPGGFEYRGTIEAGKVITLSAETDGKIVYSAVRKGIPVTKGLLLVRIDGSIRQSNYQISRDNYNKAQNDYSKFRGLFAANNATGEEMENAKLRMQNAASQLSIAEKQVSQTSVVAPDNGVIIDKKINEGEYVQPGSPLCTLACLNELLIPVYVPENKVAQIKTGSTVIVKADAYPGFSYTGSVAAVIPSSSEAHTFPVQIKLANSAKKRLMAGMNVSVFFNKDQRTKVLVIPRTALAGESKQPAVYLIRHSSPPTLIPVTIGHEYGAFLEVLGGLAPGDTIMTAGQSNVEPGAVLEHLHLLQ